MSDEKIEIRACLPGDVERLGEIAVAAWQRVHDCRKQLLPPDLYVTLHAGWQEQKANAVKGFCTSHPEWARTVTCDGKIAGFITFTLDKDKQIGEIGNNAVDPAFQGRGIGRMMYAHALDFFREQGMQYATVQTGLDDGHAPARRAYEKAGFEFPVPTVRYYKKLGDGREGP
ncbi:MAG: GNAT family N-acetyltransferase [Kiritimatiellae bacterium]|nr:GNAT family N-acetyltransferase [Kiritimatiellia bacterium]